MLLQGFPYILRDLTNLSDVWTLRTLTDTNATFTDHNNRIFMWHIETATKALEEGQLKHFSGNTVFECESGLGDGWPLGRRNPAFYSHFTTN
jgi:hypothetical protein